MNRRLAWERIVQTLSCRFVCGASVLAAAAFSPVALAATGPSPS